MSIDLNGLSLNELISHRRSVEEYIMILICRDEVRSVDNPMGLTDSEKDAYYRTGSLPGLERLHEISNGRRWLALARETKGLESS